MYHLRPVNKEASVFRCTMFDFGVLLEVCGYLFVCVNKGAQYVFVPGVDARMPEFPTLTSNDGFPVTAEEAVIMARLARNFVTIQRGLGDDHRGWPERIRADIVDYIELFAPWAEASGGFEIW